MPAKGHRHKPEALGPGGRISRGSAYGRRKKRELEQRVRDLEALIYAPQSADLSAMRRHDLIPDRASGIADIAAESKGRLIVAYEGGVCEHGAEEKQRGECDHRTMSEQRRALLDVAEHLLLLGLCEGARALQQDDGEAASRAGTLLSKFAALVKDVLGLEPHERELSLPAYLAQREAESAAHRATGSAPAEQPGDAEEVPAQAIVAPETEVPRGAEGASAETRPGGGLLTDPESTQ